MQYWVITFHSVHDALNFEKNLKKLNFDLQMIPVPREISSSCGIAAKFSLENRAKIEQAILDLDLEIEEIHLIEEKKRNRFF